MTTYLHMIFLFKNIVCHMIVHYVHVSDIIATFLSPSSLMSQDTINKLITPSLNIQNKRKLTWLVFLLPLVPHTQRYQRYAIIPKQWEKDSKQRFKKLHFSILYLISASNNYSPSFQNIISNLGIYRPRVKYSYWALLKLANLKGLLLHTSQKQTHKSNFNPQLHSPVFLVILRHVSFGRIDYKYIYNYPYHFGKDTNIVLHGTHKLVQNRKLVRSPHCSYCQIVVESYLNFVKFLSN